MRLSSHDVGSMGRKPFQEATVQHAVSQLIAPGGSKRFLVADEVGLGKTLVAQGILQHLSAIQRPLNVFYICSSLTIASQNRDNLLEVLPRDLRKRAVVDVDRPTLLPWTDPSIDTPFTLFTLTPGTLPMNSSSRGRVDERASIWCLLREGLSDGGASLSKIEQQLKLVRDETWRYEVDKRSQGVMRLRMKELALPFVADLRGWLKLPQASDRAVAGVLAERLAAKGQFTTIQSLRKRLGRLGLERLRPDVVILDEFQRFFEILEPFSIDTDCRASGGLEDMKNAADEDKDADAEGLLRLLLEAPAGAAGPAILLLSATPYRPPAGGVDGAGIRHYKQFFRLLEFLYGDRAREEVPALRGMFRRYGNLLREAAPGDSAVLTLRDEIQSRLARVIARTERAGLLGENGYPSAPYRHSVDLCANDVRIHRQLWMAASELDRSAVTPYWTSIPFPLQMMDKRYKLRERAAVQTASSGSLVLRSSQVRRYEAVDPPHPRMRALLSALGGPLLRLPWLPPTLRWWKLGRPFQDAIESAGTGGLSKILLFSRFRAVPRAVASLISFEAERGVYSDPQHPARRYDYRARRRGGRDEESAPEPGLEPLPSPSFNWQSRQAAGGGRELDHSLLSMFIPAPVLARLGNPQTISGFAAGGLTRGAAMEMVSQRLRRQLAEVGVAVVAGRRSGQTWRAIVKLETTGSTAFESFLRALGAWSAHSANRAARAVCEAWIHEGRRSRSGFDLPLTVTEEDLDDLVDLALVGPGVVLLRAVDRVFDQAGDLTSRLRGVMDVSLGAFRPYFDEPEFHITLNTHGNETVNHPANVRRAVWNGNLEAVLDEYFAMHAGLGATSIDAGRETKALESLGQALSVRVSTIRAQSLEAPETFSLRCHVAMPFGLTPDKDEQSDGVTEARPDALRRAFNSPFRPFVLATTSIGQEGLDFHTYCDQLVHWDLPSSPVDLEQRDGRINRYGGLSVRKALVGRRVSQRLPAERSPWMVLTRALGETCQGMEPWWGTEGATIRRTVFLPPLAKQAEELDRLLEGLSHYRLALGQADPDELMSALERRVADARSEEERLALRAWLLEARIDLSPGGTRALATT